MEEGMEGGGETAEVGEGWGSRTRGVVHKWNGDRSLDDTLLAIDVVEFAI